MRNIIIEFGEQTDNPTEGISRDKLTELKQALRSDETAVEVTGLPPSASGAGFAPAVLAVWYGVKVVAKFVIDHDDTWEAVTKFIADVMDGHLHDGWVQIDVAADGTVVQTTHKGNEHPEGSIVTIKDGKEEVHESTSAQFSRDDFLKALREILKALL